MASQQEFTLDTSSMAATAEHCKKLYETLQDWRTDMEEKKNQLLWTWIGKGRNEFEKQYRLLNQQLSDIIDDTKDMYEKIIDAEEAYIQADVDAAKQADGVDNKF